METLKEQQEFISEINDNTPLEANIIKEYGFVCERPRQYNSDLDGIWYNGYNLNEDFDSGEFHFATYVRGSGCMKSGYTVETVGRLKALHFGITGSMLIKKVIEMPNKL